MNLSDFDDAVAARAERWQHAGVTWELRPPSQTAKPSASVRVESSTTIAELIVWVSGEAELIHASLVKEGDPVVEQYELTGRLGLDGCLDDLEGHLGP